MTAQSGWHELIERYTSNDTPGRILITIFSGIFGVYTLTWSVATFMTSGLLIPLVLLLVALSLSAISLSIMGFWKIYISLVGDEELIESHKHVDTMPSLEGKRDDSLAVAKRQYAAGNITEKEFEQRIENILDTDAKSRSEPGTMSRRTSEDNQESN